MRDAHRFESLMNENCSSEEKKKTVFVRKLQTLLNPTNESLATWLLGVTALITHGRAKQQLCPYLFYSNVWKLPWKGTSIIRLWEAICPDRWAVRSQSVLIFNFMVILTLLWISWFYYVGFMWGCVNGTASIRRLMAGNGDLLGKFVIRSNLGSFVMYMSFRSVIFLNTLSTAFQFLPVH